MAEELEQALNEKAPGLDGHEDRSGLMANKSNAINLRRLFLNIQTHLGAGRFSPWTLPPNFFSICPVVI